MGTTKTELARYGDLLGEIKGRIRAAQFRAVQAVNTELLRLYWDIGRLIEARQVQEGWGAGVIPRLARDLHNELPELKGFSERNLKLMVQFAREYPDLFEFGQTVSAQMDGAGGGGEIGQPPSAPIVLAQIPWAHNVLLIQKVKDTSTRLWYARQILEQGWSHDTLAAMIRSGAHARQGAAITNFPSRLAREHSAMAAELLKDPYVFDFLTLDEPFHERELETGLVRHLEKFLLELGQGFAFVGRQYRLEVSAKEFFLDLLFYHLALRCFIVVDLKRGDFKPEYAGKMNFYCSVVDDRLRHADDRPTIGLILCQTKDRILAEYTLRDIGKPIGVADYEIARALPAALASSLPSIEQIEAALQGNPPPEDGEA
jgi:predicted nuclease of restriction endonuclease-like (RecB) superfamily